MIIYESDPGPYTYICDGCGATDTPEFNTCGDWQVPGVGGEFPYGDGFVYLCARCTGSALLMLQAARNNGWALENIRPEKPAPARRKTFEFKVTEYASTYHVGHNFGTDAIVVRAWLEFPGGSEELEGHIFGWSVWRPDLHTLKVNLDPQYFLDAIGGTLHVAVSA